jgi:hypothetical protein
MAIAGTSLLVSMVVNVAGANSPAVVVVMSRLSGMQESQALPTARCISNALSASGIRVTKDPEAALAKLMDLGAPRASECAGRRACLAQRGKLLDADVVVGVDVAAMSKTISVHAEAISVASGDRIVDSDFTFVHSARGDDGAKECARFARKLLPMLATLPPRPPPAPIPPPPAPTASEPTTASSSPASDVPTQPAGAVATRTTAEPVFVTSPAATASESHGSTLRLVGWGALGGSVVAAGVGGVLAFSGFQQQGQINGAWTTSSNGSAALRLPGSKVQGLVDGANSNFSGAAVAAVCSIAFAAAAALLFANSGSTPKEPPH